MRVIPVSLPKYLLHRHSQVPTDMGIMVSPHRTWRYHHFPQKGPVGERSLGQAPRALVM